MKTTITLVAAAFLIGCFASTSAAQRAPVQTTIVNNAPPPTVDVVSGG